MIQQEDFENLEILNKFVDKYQYKVVSIETINKPYNTGLPMFNEGVFWSEKEYKRLYYET